METPTIHKGKAVFKLSARAAAITVLSATAIIGGTVAAASASASASPAPATHAPGDAVSPPGYQKVYDDLGWLAISIPADWTVESTAPDMLYEGEAWPMIEASGRDWTRPVERAQLTYWAVPREEPLVAFEPECTPEQEQVSDCEPFYGVEPFDSDWYTGYRASLGTGTTGADRQLVKFNPQGSTFTYYLQFYAGSGDASVFDTILQTIEVTSPPQTPAPTPAPAAPNPQSTTGMVPVDGGPGVSEFWGVFRSVPQMGAEPVRGSGCGSNGEIGDEIPDGTYAAFVSWDPGGNDVFDVDLLCVYTPEAAQGVIDAGTATIINNDPNYLVVNNNTQTRRVPTTMFVAQFEYVDDGNGNCVLGSASGPGDPSRQAWIQIDGGVATAVGWDCRPLDVAGPSAPPADTSEFTDHFPWGAFWNVPQLGSAPVRGSGCGSGTDGDTLGDTIPDGWWAGYVSTDYDTETLWVDVVCVYYGESAQAVLAAGTANVVNAEPDYLIVNNDERRRAVPNGIGAYNIAVGVSSGGECVPNSLGYVQLGNGLPSQQLMDAAADDQAWIHIEGGRATALVYGCDVEL